MRDRSFIVRRPYWWGAAGLIVALALLCSQLPIIWIRVRSQANFVKPTDKGFLLFIAVANDKMDSVQEMIKADINYARSIRDKNGLSLLDDAVISRRYDLIPVLLDNDGFDVNDRLPGQKSGGGAALIFAAIGNDERAVDLLLVHGADPNVSDRAGNTPIGQARLYRNQKMLRMLIEKGAK